MAKLTHLVIHCSATSAMQNFTAKDIEIWHLAPKDIWKNGKYLGVHYMNKTYPSRAALPNHTINGHPIANLKGNGWSRPGYADVIERDGTIVNLVKYNSDNIVDPWEITYGVAGENSHTRHVCMMGGVKKKDIAEFNFTHAQLLSLRNYVTITINNHPDILIAGHNQFDAHKFCPSFIVPDWAEEFAPKKNIEYKNYKNNPWFDEYKI